MNDLSKYCDKDGYPGTLQEDGTWDGGDTAAILGTLWFFNKGPSLPLPFNGNAPARHPDKSKWYGQPDRFSRDQLIPILCDLAMNSSVIPRLRTSHKSRYYLTAWNTRKNGVMDAPKKFPDFTGPEVWALWLRVYKPWWARLVLPFLDLELLLSAIHWRFFRKDRVTRNHMLSLLACNKVLPNLVTKLAYNITNWDALVTRWDEHCKAVGEYPTAELFRDYHIFWELLK